MLATEQKNTVTLAESGKRQKLNLTLKELEISEQSNYLNDKPKDLFELFVELVMYSPTDESHLGISWQDFKERVPNESVNKFSQLLIKALGVEDVFVFDAYESKDTNRCDIKEQVLQSNKSMICLYIKKDGLLKSLYTSIRNALAHGNIVLKDGFFCLYSVPPSPKSEYDKPITFFLRVCSIDKLWAYVDARDSACRK